MGITKGHNKFNYENQFCETEKFITAPGKKQRKTLLNPSEESQTRPVGGGHELHFSNLSKVYWPKEGNTKRDMLNYYYNIAPYILPYMKGRPQS